MAAHARASHTVILVVTLALLAAACNSDGAFDQSRCAASFNAALEDGRFPVPQAVDAVGRVAFQAADDWEGRTPVCWVSVSTATQCRSFMLDVGRGTTPSGWADIGTNAGPCQPELDAEFSLSNAIDTGFTPSRAMQSIAQT